MEVHKRTSEAGAASSAPVRRGRVRHRVEAELQAHGASDAHLAAPQAPWCGAPPAYPPRQLCGSGRLC